MKKIEAIIQPYKLDAVKEALKGAGIEGVTIFDARGYGRQKGHVEVYRGQEYEVDFRPKVKMELVVPEEELDRVIDILIGSARSGRIGDGKIFVSTIEDAVRIRNGDRGENAL